MSCSNDKLFATYIQTDCSDLLTDLANCLKVQIQVLDNQDEIVFATDQAGEDDSVTLSSDRERFWAPLDCLGDSLGSLIAFANDHTVGPLLVSVANQINNQFAVEKDLDRLTEQLAQAYDEINLLYRLGRSLKPDQEFVNTATNLLEESADFLENRLLTLFVPDHDCLINSAGVDFSNGNPVLQVTSNADSLRTIYKAMSTSIETNGKTARYPGTVLSHSGSVHYVVTPVYIRNQITGFVGQFKIDDDSGFETGELRLLECLGEEISNVITTRELYQELQDMLFDTVKGLVAAIDAKDQYTRGHSDRVYEYSMKLGENMGFNREEMLSLSWSAMLHDVGKIAIGRSILNKADKLTDQEYEIIKTHPANGGKGLEPISQLQEVLPNIRHHHERFDGKGYPDGLAGTDIPLMARIIAVADTFDAITSSRAYRKAQNLDFAINQIRTGAGSQFDPEIASLMLELIDKHEIDDIKHCQVVNEEGLENEAA